MIDVSGVFPKVTIVSASVVPLINVTHFADDSNPVDVEQIEVTGHAINVNGELVTWEKPTAYIASISVLCGTDDDNDLAILLEASHATSDKGFALAPTITMRQVIGKRNSLGVVTTDDAASFTKGKIVSGRPSAAVDSDGKKLSNTYTFVFENMVRS